MLKQANLTILIIFITVLFASLSACGPLGGPTMSEADQVRRQWDRIEGWLHEHHPEALQHLNGPAGEAALAAAEEKLGMPLPVALRTSYRKFTCSP
jgi:hypothetical protein